MNRPRQKRQVVAILPHLYRITLHKCNAIPWLCPAAENRKKEDKRLSLCVTWRYEYIIPIGLKLCTRWDEWYASRPSRFSTGGALNWKLAGTEGQSGRFKEDIKLFHLRESNQGSSDVQTVFSSLYRLC